MNVRFFQQYKLLKPEFKSICDFSSIVGGILGFTILLPYSWFISFTIGIDPNECIRCQDGGTIWIIGLLTGMAIFMVLAMNLVLWFRLRHMMEKGNISKSETKALLLWQSYPAAWLNEKNT